MPDSVVSLENVAHEHLGQLRSAVAFGEFPEVVALLSEDVVPVEVGVLRCVVELVEQVIPVQREHLVSGGLGGESRIVRVLVNKQDVQECRAESRIGLDQVHLALHFEEGVSSSIEGCIMTLTFLALIVSSQNVDSLATLEVLLDGGVD